MYNFQTHYAEYQLGHLLWNCWQMNITEPHSRGVKFGVSNGLVSPGIVEVQEWMSNFIPHIIMNVIIYPCRNLSQTMLLKKADFAEIPNNIAVSNMIGIILVDHYSDVIMCAMASRNTGVSIGCSTVCSGADQRNTKVPRFPLWGELTGDWWILHTKGR